MTRGHFSHITGGEGCPDRHTLLHSRCRKLWTNHRGVLDTQVPPTSRVCANGEEKRRGESYWDWRSPWSWHPHKQQSTKQIKQRNPRLFTQSPRRIKCRIIIGPNTVKSEEEVGEKGFLYGTENTRDQWKQTHPERAILSKNTKEF